MGTIGDEYQAKYKAVVEANKEEFKKAFKALESAAARLGLSEEYSQIFDEGGNIAAKLAKFAREHGLITAYRQAMKNLPYPVRAALSKGYSEVWTDEQIQKMKEAAETLRKAYKYLLRGDYEAAAKAAGIDASKINGKSAREAMREIAKALSLSDTYSEIIKKRTGRKLNAKAIIAEK